ncbi:MAG: site-specific integrase [Planctomycetes bacterium]|nr:site-specific integrase [Planctomycetota bacterium]
MPENPLQDVPKPDATSEQRHARRALEPDEVQRLLNAAQCGPERYGMTGEQRYWLYRLAIETGFRAGELRSLTRANLIVDHVRPTATVSAAFAKNRHERTIPLKAETANGLRTFLGAKLPKASVFQLPRSENIVRMLRGDLAQAEVPYVDDAERYADFHSLRATFATNLIAAGVDVKTAQELLGHATSKMTLDVYAKVLRGSREDAIQRLPDFDHPGPQTGRATGTYDATPVGTDATVAKTALDGSQNGACRVRGDAPQRINQGNMGHAENIGKHSVSTRLTAQQTERRSGPNRTPPRGLEPLSPA